MISRHACAKVRVGRRKYGLTVSSNGISWSSTGQLFFLFLFPRAGRTRPLSPHFNQFPKVSRGVLRIIQFGAVTGRKHLFVVTTKDKMCLERLTPKLKKPVANRPLERLLRGAGPTADRFFYARVLCPSPALNMICGPGNDRWRGFFCRRNDHAPHPGPPICQAYFCNNYNVIMRPNRYASLNSKGATERDLARQRLREVHCDDQLETPPPSLRQTFFPIISERRFFSCKQQCISTFGAT